MTKKKASEDKKKAGRKQEIKDNFDLFCLFKEVKAMNELSGKCRLVISGTIKAIMGGTKEAYAPRKIFHIIQNESKISTESVKHRIEGNEIFGRFSYSDESVKKYKRVVLAVIQALEEELAKGTPLLKSDPDAHKYLNADEALELRTMISDGRTKEELVAYIQGLI